MIKLHGNGLDAPRVNHDEAVELFIHHLEMAAMYFQATPTDDCKQITEELSRVITLDRGYGGFWKEHQRAMEKFALDLYTIYEEDKNND
jgi:hypothetical protein